MSNSKNNNDVTKLVTIRDIRVDYTQVNFYSADRRWIPDGYTETLTGVTRYAISMASPEVMMARFSVLNELAKTTELRSEVDFYVSVAIRSGYAHLTIGGPDIGKALDFIRGRIYRINSHIWLEDHPVSEGTGKIVLKVPECFPVLYSLYGCHTSSEG